MKRLIIAGIIVTIFTGCSKTSSTVDKSITQIEKAINQMEEKKDNLSAEDWYSIEKETEEPMKVVTDALENGQGGVKVKMKLVSLMAKWATVVTDIGFRENEKTRELNLLNKKHYEQN